MGNTYQSAAIISRNTYQYNNSSIFYSLINNGFLPYYQQVIRKSQEWLDGYDPNFHKDDIVSTRIAARLFNAFRNAIYGRGLVFVKGRGNTDTENKALDFISHTWVDISNLQNAVKQLIGYCVPLGTSALKTNRDAKGNLWVEPLRIDYFYFSVDGRKNVIEFTSFIRAFQSVENEEENYFLVEKRYFAMVDEEFEGELNGQKRIFTKKVRKPVVEYRIYEYKGTVNANTMPTICKGDGINYKNLPNFVRLALKEQYSTYKIGEPQVLPFVDDDLGVDLFFNEGGDITNPSLPFGRVLCFDCLSDFMEFDMNKSYALRDLYNSKGIVGVPRALNQGDLQQVVPGTAGAMTHNTAYAQLNIPGYEVVKGLDPQTQKPIITQFEMRVDEHEKEDMKILKSIATIVGVSPKTIASFLAPTTQATDDQIQSEDDTITQWIKSHREDYILGLNKLIERVLNANGYQDNVEVRFASDGLLKSDKQLESIEKRLDLGLIDIEDAIRELNPDLDEVQLQQKIVKAQNIKQEKINEQITEMNSFGGGFGNENEELQ